jgi:hypothetical protein
MQVESRFHESLTILLTCKLWNRDEKIISGIISNLSSLQRIILRIRGSVFLETISLRGWTDKLPLYLFKCDKHGYQVSYPTGYMMVLYCPKCLHDEQTFEAEFE